MPRVNDLLPVELERRQNCFAAHDIRYRLPCDPIERVIGALSGVSPMRFNLDDPSKKAPQDAAQVSISDDYEVRYWTTTLSVTKARLIEAVTKVGTSVIAVRQELAPLAGLSTVTTDAAADSKSGPRHSENMPSGACLLTLDSYDPKHT